MTRNEFMSKYDKSYKNANNAYSVPDIRKAFPQLIFFYRNKVKTIKNYQLYDDDMQKKYVTHSYAKKHKISIIDDIVGFLCTQYGCYPVYRVKKL